MIEKTCQCCKKTFLVKPYRKNLARYCSYDCYWKTEVGEKHHGFVKTKISCGFCKKSFYTKPFVIRGGGGKFCSPKCYAKGRVGIYTGANHPSWKGGKFRMTAGYITVHSPKHPFKNSDGYVSEHRLVMEKKLGRFLDPKEVIHHINGIKSDNRAENLQLFKSNSDHTKHHAALRHKK